VRQAVPLQPMEVHGGAGLLAELVSPWVTHAGTVCSEGLHPMERTHVAAVHKELQPMGRTHVWRSSWRTVSCWSKGRK